MPQLAFWVRRHPVRFEVIYEVNPAASTPPSLSVVIKDQRGNVLDRASALLPSDVVWEAGRDSLDACWDTYLFGELGGLQRALSVVVGKWREASKARS